MDECGARPCWGLKSRLVEYWQKLWLMLWKDIDADVLLHNMYSHVNSRFLTRELSSLDAQYVCRKKDSAECHCEWSITQAIQEMLEKITPGEVIGHGLCYKCFKAGECTIQYECRVHQS